MNSKNKGIVTVLIVGVVCAVIAGVALFMYLNPQKTTIYTFNESYKAGEVVTKDMLTPVQCDSTIIIAGRKANASSQFVTGANIDEVLYSGDSLRMDVSEGMPLTLSLLSVNGGSSIEMNMDPSKIAVTVPINDISGVTRDLKEGSRVNIYATGIDTASTTLLFQNMRVLAVDYDSSGSLSGATIEVDAGQSLKLVYAANYSSIYFGLVDSSGYEYTSGEPSYSPGAATTIIP